MRKNFILKGLLFSLFSLFAINLAFSQNTESIIRNYLQEHRAELRLTQADVTNWKITDQHTTKHNQVTHVYIVQTHNNIPVFNGVANFAIQNGKVEHMGNSLVKEVAGFANSTVPAITPMQAATKAAEHLGLTPTDPFRVITAESPREFILNDGGISREDVSVQLVYMPMEEGELYLAWNIVINDKESNDWWDMRMDAMTGEFLHKYNYTLYCDFGTPDSDHPHPHAEANPTPPSVQRVNQPDAYRVYPIPVESPNHGGRQLVTNPADLTASPFGWHDTNGQTGAEFTITRGNNVHATEDRNDDNNPGFAPSGGSLLEFDFPLNLSNQPATYESAAITNLFFWNNLMHDVWYQYGFDEAAGNFQENNYGNGGSASDYVNADAQDGGGVNDANFATPADGGNPRMQMYLWTTSGNSANFLTVNSPTAIAGAYNSTDATFGPGIPATPITRDVVIATDGTTPNTADACDPITNGSAMNNKIALIDRGDCTFVSKVENAQNNGAVAVIIVNNVAGAPVTMGGASSTITIPSIMISQADGNAIKAQINGGTTVNATIGAVGGGNVDKDGDLDNGIIAHEYGHGISIRLTGGRTNSGCLNNSEQMGEGWSDYFGLVMTIEPGDSAHDVRGIGTYAIGQGTTGGGIREAPYSTDFAVNNYTYADVAGNVSQPHGIGFVWCTMLWDMTWALIDQYGWDPDVYNGTGGNNIAMQLVIDGCKLQSCNPGFIDGRDAILQADQLNNGGANQCLIWEAFANRGLGFSASQGSSNSRSDGVEAYDLPPSCLTPTQAPNAQFTSTVDCSGEVTFTDASGNVPQGWNWNFGDGNSSTSQNPTHTYANNGTYTVTLIVSNTIGADTTTGTVTVSLPAAPTNVVGGNGCPGVFNLTAQGPNLLVWQNAQGATVGTGSTFTTPFLNTSQNYTVYNVVAPAAVNHPPANPNFGGGSIHSSAFVGTHNFDAFTSFTIVSAWVDADGAGNRTFTLWDSPSGGGNIVDQVTVNIPDGQSRINLGLYVPGPGTYSVGGSNVDLYRNNSGANYPYTTPGIMSITSSSATTAPLGYYYYLYDMELQEDSCFSAGVTANVTVSPVNFSTSINQNTVTFTDQTQGATSWNWDFGDGNTSTQQNPVHTYAATGVYTVTLTVDVGGCTVEKDVNILTVGRVELAGGTNVDILPNPASDYVTIRLDHAIERDIAVELVNVNGQVLQEQVLERGKESLKLNLQQYPAGLYFVNMTSNGQTQTHKVIVSR